MYKKREDHHLEDVIFGAIVLDLDLDLDLDHLDLDLDHLDHLVGVIVGVINYLGLHHIEGMKIKRK